METPEHERRWIEDYLRSQSGAEFAIEHVEKLTTEYVLGRQYDVWDAHTNEGRWWVITNPVNLYSQDAFKSMDVALSFHIGLMSRVLSKERRRHDDRDSWALEVLRRLDVAGESLDRAQEVEDYQAVGMRLREALVTLGEHLASLGIISPGPDEAPKRGDFKGWATLAAGQLASASDKDRLRGLLIAGAERTWAYVSWLTHARGATELDARLALCATTHIVDIFLMSVMRWRAGGPQRCPICGSYRVAEYSASDGWQQACHTCGWAAPLEAPEPAADKSEHSRDSISPPEGECIVIDDFGVYMAPRQAREMLTEAESRMLSNVDSWSNPFAFAVAPTEIIDAHRLAFEANGASASLGVELVYECENDACVNPEHASQETLPSPEGWHFKVIESVRFLPQHFELVGTSPDGAITRVLVDRGVLDTFGLGDASSLLERVMLVSQPDASGWVSVLLGERRVDHGVVSFAQGWVRQRGQVSDDQSCPCGSGSEYPSCHGAEFGE